MSYVTLLTLCRPGRKYRQPSQCTYKFSPVLRFYASFFFRERGREVSSLAAVTDSIQSRIAEINSLFFLKPPIANEWAIEKAYFHAEIHRKTFIFWGISTFHHHQNLSEKTFVISISFFTKINKLQPDPVKSLWIKETLHIPFRHATSAKHSLGTYKTRCAFFLFTT